MTEPRTVGPYEVARSLGSGGMGTVYLARRTDGAFDAEVALKLLRPALVGTDVARRFRRERQILADLSHPGIARLIDGGETADGVPYLVMEYVEGTSLDRYCEEGGLGVRDLLRLFRDVCEAVQHAHAKLVVHTDLKPSNVLVDSAGRVRLLDFGIAKFLTGAAATDAGRGAETTLRAMTPAYASPEQVRGDPLATSTDVYSLGVVLYELLTGSLPYPEDQRTGRALEDAVLGHDPEPPSRAARTRAGGGRTTTRGSAARIDRDVDTIVLKALRKDPARRYASVEQLADDLDRYLDGRPVRARPDTWGYRTGKFVRRNRGSVVGGLTTVLSVILFGAVSASQAVRLEQERDAAEAAREEAEAVTEFLVDVFDATDPNRAQGLDLTARDILGRGAVRVREELTGQPGVQRAVAAAIGDAYLSLGAADSAVASLEFAVDRARAATGESSVPFGSALAALGNAERAISRYDEAEANVRRALEILLETAGPDAVETSTVWNNLGSLLSGRVEYEEAEAAYLESLRIREEQLGPTHLWTLTVLNNLATLYTDMGRHEDAIGYARRALDGRLERHGDTAHLDVALSLNNLGSALEYAGRYDEAEPYYRRSLEIRSALLDESHPRILTLKNNLGTLYIRAGRPEEAVPILESVIEAMRANGEQGMSLARTLSNHAVALIRSGSPEDAVPVLSEAEEAIVTSLGPESPMLAFTRQSLGDVYTMLGRFEEAEPLYRSALDVRLAALAPDNPNVAFSKSKLGTFLMDRGRLDEAAPLLEEALELRSAVLDPSHPDLVDSLIKVGRLRALRGDRAEARRLLEEAIRLGVEARGEEDAQVVSARRILEEEAG